MLSLITREPDRVPVVVGVKVTLMEHAALAARVAAQLLDAAKSPLGATPVIFKVSLPVLVSVTC